ncbi:MAG TPA: DUF349 domain-containing protein [Candidatus Avibacteroides excrementipullorum]|nr:DUF349 domain-containing protein [Candidatus Avibacteroides excrementipullorum]
MEDMDNNEKVDVVSSMEEKANNDEGQMVNAALTKEEIIKRFEEILQNIENVGRQDIEHLKQAFYKIRKHETDAARKAFVENGGDADAFVPEADEYEQKFKELVSAIKEKRTEIAKAAEQLKEENLEKKNRIIEKIKEFISSGEDVNKYYNEFKQLRQEWNDIKLIPQEKATELWKNYQLYVERFYDLLKINNEFRTYDFKKNLELKTALCEAAEKLEEEPDVVSAFYQLQNLHHEFREIGPVAPEMREEIWGRFKKASTVINKKHQQHFEELKAKEQGNYEAKQAICEKIESIDCTALKTFADWDEKTNEVIALQSEWKTIGFAPQKLNVKIFERFRAACDAFFKAKSEFYKTIKTEKNENLQRKIALAERAEALKDSTDWKKTTEELTRLQKEWKTIGSVSKKYSDAVWNRFISACDYFFEQKKNMFAGQKSEEQANLAAKLELIEQIESIPEDADAAEALKTVKELQEKWNSIGFVPFKEKDKIYKRFIASVDKWYDSYRQGVSDRRISAFKDNIDRIASKDGNAVNGLYRERDKVVKMYESMKSELATYENNMSFLNVSSKNSSFMQEINKKIEKLKSDIKLAEEKLAAINETIRNQQK